MSTAEAKPIVEYSRIEGGLAVLRQKYHGAVFQVTTTKGMAEAKAARAELRGTRVNLEAARVKAKEEALQHGRRVDAEAKRILVELTALEEPIDASIRAQEEIKEREKEAKAEAERKRIAGIHDKIAGIKMVPYDFVGKNATEIRAAIEKLAPLEPTADIFGEFVAEATAALDDTRARLQRMLIARVEFEAEEARQAEARLALEAEQKAQREREAEAKRVRDAEDAKRKKENDEREAALKAERDKLDQEKREHEAKVDAENKRRAAEEARKIAQQQQEAHEAARKIEQRKDAERRRLAIDNYKTEFQGDALSAFRVVAINATDPSLDEETALRSIELIAVAMIEALETAEEAKQ